MKILVANNQLDSIGGTETYVYSIIEELIRRDHFVEYFTFKKGITSCKIEELGVNFMSLKKYDLILANHNTCVDYLFEKGFIIQTCHGIFNKLEEASNLADFHVAISNEVSNYLSNKGFINKIIFNGINLKRFDIIKPINQELKNILSLSQSNELNSYLTQFCEKFNYNLTILNKHENPIWDIEKIINQNDIVIALGRSAYDSISCGRPVLILDQRNYYNSKIFIGDGYISNNLGLFLLNNCSGRYSNIEFNENILKKELNNYNYFDSSKLRLIAEKNFNIINSVDEYFKVYNIYTNKLNKKFFNRILLIKLLKKRYLIFLKYLYNIFKK